MPSQPTRTKPPQRPAQPTATQPPAQAQGQPSQAVAKREPGPAGMIAAYASSFEAVLPSHVKAITWVRLAQGALKRGKKVDVRADPMFGRYILEVAAMSNPGLFMATLLDAARLGLEPGTEEYYLTPRRVKGEWQILGVVGYQGYLELMHRSGAVSSVVAEVVHQADKFNYAPGRDPVPQHEIDWDAEDRGPLRLVYAYARMKDGGTSRVVVLNRTDIARIMASSEGAGSEYSPWQKHTDAMWLKSAVRQLRKWVPTSAEYRREEMRARAEADRITNENSLPAAPVDYDFLDGEVVGESDPEPDQREAEPPTEAEAEAEAEAERQTGTGWPDVARVPAPADGDQEGRLL